MLAYYILTFLIGVGLVALTAEWAYRRKIKELEEEVEC